MEERQRGDSVTLRWSCWRLSGCFRIVGAVVDTVEVFKEHRAISEFFSSSEPGELAFFSHFAPFVEVEASDLLAPASFSNSASLLLSFWRYFLCVVHAVSKPKQTLRKCVIT